MRAKSVLVPHTTGAFGRLASYPALLSHMKLLSTLRLSDVTVSPTREHKSTHPS